MTGASQNKSLLKRVLANAGVLLGGRVVNAVVSLAYTAVAARALGAAAMGVLILINAYCQLVSDVARFQSWQTVLTYGAGPFARGDKARVQQVVRFTLLLDLGGGLLGVLVGAAGGLLFDTELGWPPALAGAAALYAISILFIDPATPIGILRLSDRFDLLTPQFPIVSVVRLIGGAIAWVMDGGVEGFLLAWAAGTVASFAYLSFVAVREMARRDLLSGFSLRGPVAAGLPGVWRFAWATNFNATVETAFNHVVTLVVGAVLGPASAALWRVGRQVADAMAKPAKLLAPALYPELARLRAAQGEAAMGRLALQVGLLGGGVATGLLLLTVLLGGPILTVTMGEAFAPAAGVMIWQVAAAAVGIWALPIEPMLVSMNRAGLALRVRLIVCVGYLAILTPMIRAYGANGAGFSLLAAAVVLGLGMLLALRTARAAEIPAENSLASATETEPKPQS